MLPVLLLFLIPLGAGIPAGVLLARNGGLYWPVTMFLYLVSDVILALYFEPILRLVISLCRKTPQLARAAQAMRTAISQIMAQYGGGGVGPFALILISFGVDPMTGRAATVLAGHGVVSGWSLAITGDMMYYALVAYTTLKVDSALGNAYATTALVMMCMIVVPILVRRARTAFSRI
ncbi:MAG: hypothetical protein HY077_08955 [Elusimicrobia bacterium]|nr:hypothetical protein [Elusimicrobiota bacterium]